MRILQLVTRRQHRGAEVFASLLSSELAARGHEVVFAGLYLPGKLPLESKGLRNMDLGGLRLPFNPLLFLKLIRLIRQFKPDVIQANGSDTLKYASLAGRFNKKPRLVYRNISMVSSWVNNNTFRKAFNKFLFGRVDAVVSVGEQARLNIIKTYGLPENKVTVIKRGLEPIIHDTSRAREDIIKEFGLPANTKILIHVGRFSSEKNHPFIISSFSLLKERCADACLLFVGEGEKMADIKKSVQENKLEDKVFFAGQRTDVLRLMAGADILLLGSTVEGVPGVILEAAQQSVPSVAVSVGGVGEVVRNRITGVLLNEHDTVAFSQSIFELLTDDALRKKMGENAKELVLREYSLESSARVFEGLYGSLISKNQ